MLKYNVIQNIGIMQTQATGKGTIKYFSLTLSYDENKTLKEIVVVQLTINRKTNKKQNSNENNYARVVGQ